MTDPISGSPEYAIQFTHVDSALRLSDGHSIADHCLAELIYGTDAETAAKVRAEIAHRVRLAADELLEDAAFATSFAAVPFSSDDIIVAYGDSMTADLYSWAHILAAIIDRVGQAGRPTIVNLGRSADTTTHLIERFSSVVAARPTHVIVQVGTNDAKEFDFTPGTTLVPLDCTRRNVAVIDEGIRSIGATATWILPPNFYAPAVLNCEMWADQRIRWIPDNLDRVRGEIRKAVGSTVDLSETFNGPGLPSLMLEDGLHPNLRGHQSIVKDLIARLAV
ncbi:SGNH/GDSL hydrolase family protein [Nocardia sp. NPDC001965]